MAYIGNDPSNRFVAPKAASVFSGDGSTTAFTLDHAVGSDEDILVSVDGVIQEPSVAYAVSNGTTLTFTAAPSSNAGNNIFVYYLFRTVATVDHPSTSSLQATDGTFSSTLNVTGDATFDTSTLKVDASNNRVGIGTASPSVPLDVGDNDSGSAGTTGIQIQNSQAFATVYDGTNIGTFAGIQTVNHDDTSNRTATGLTFVHRSSGSGIASIQSTSTASDRADLRFITRGSDGINERMRISNSGAVTMPNQPAFSAHFNATGITNFDNTPSAVSLPFTHERFDTGTNFNTSNGTFTAPVTGKYSFNLTVRINSIDTAATYYIINIGTSNETYRHIIDPNFSSDLSYRTFNVVILADMDENDICVAQVLQSGGTQQSDIDGNPEYTYFSGHLVC